MGTSMLGKRVTGSSSEAHGAEQCQDRKRNDRGDGLADRPGGDVEAHRRAPYPLTAVASAVGRTRSPARRNAAARVTPRSRPQRRLLGFPPNRRQRCPASPGASRPFRRAPRRGAPHRHPAPTRSRERQRPGDGRVRPILRRRPRYGRAKRRQARSVPCRCGSLCRLPGSRGGHGLRPALRRPAASVPPACRRRGGRASARARRPRDRPLHPQ